MIKRDFNKFIFNGKRIKNPQSLLCAILLPTNINEDNIIPWLNKVEIFIEADLQRDYCNLNKKHFRTLKKKNKELVNFDKVKYILNNKGYGSNGGYNKDKKQINLYEVNKHIKESLIDLILTLAHEMRHHAQVYGLIPDQLKLEKSNPITRYHYFIEMIMLFYDKKNDHSIKTDDIYRLEDAMSFAYYGDEHEMDARMYSLNLVYDMLDSLDRTNLTKDQKEMLKKHRKILLRHMQNEVELMSRIESVDKNIIKNMFKLVKTERDKIYKSKEFKEAYQHYFEGETDDLHRDVLYIKVIIESLTFCYDDNIAHELFDNLLKANNKNALKYKVSILKMLYIETQIELTQEEQQEFDKILEEESDNSKNILLESYKKSEFENFEKIYGRYLQEDEKQLTK